MLVTSDATLKHASGMEVAKVSSAAFASELRQAPRVEEQPGGLAGKLDDETTRRGSSSSAEASKRVHRKQGLCSLRDLATFIST